MGYATVQQKVDAENALRKAAIKLHAAAAPLLTDAIGSKILRADDQLTAKFRRELDVIAAPFRTDDGSSRLVFDTRFGGYLSAHIHLRRSTSDIDVFYTSKEVNLCRIKDGVLVAVFDAPSWPSLTLAQVRRAQKRRDKARAELAEAEHYLRFLER